MCVVGCCYFRPSKPHSGTLWVVAAFNQEKALEGAFSGITKLRMELFEALVSALQCLTLISKHCMVTKVWSNIHPDKYHLKDVMSNVVSFFPQASPQLHIGHEMSESMRYFIELV